MEKPVPSSRPASERYRVLALEPDERLRTRTLDSRELPRFRGSSLDYVLGDLCAGRADRCCSREPRQRHVARGCATSVGRRFPRPRRHARRRATLPNLQAALPPRPRLIGIDRRVRNPPGVERVGDAHVVTRESCAGGGGRVHVFRQGHHRVLDQVASARAWSQRLGGRARDPRPPGERCSSTRPAIRRRGCAAASPTVHTTDAARRSTHADQHAWMGCSADARGVGTARVVRTGRTVGRRQDHTRGDGRHHSHAAPYVLVRGD